MKWQESEICTGGQLNMVLIGALEHPKIYGAGLLSSIGESKWCMGDQVKKIPYSIDAAKVEFDITKPQPQLFVTPDFAHLSLVLEEYANSMALRKGGLKGVQKLIESKNLGTIEAKYRNSNFRENSLRLLKMKDQDLSILKRPDQQHLLIKIKN